MRRKKANKQSEIIAILGIVFTLSIVALNVNASPITHEFKNPSFNGIGASAHYLTIDEQETKRRDELAERIQAELDEIQREIDNSTLNKFLSNLQSRIFSNLSRDISDMLFSEDGGTGGTIELEGNTISFSNDGEYITLTVIDENGTITEIVIPIGVFGVCTSDCGV
jgi:hypothetical protein|tara:strand:+ start:254 stop:754 length:501 start_codon:yes stop_codon:yes gene_type:complete